MSPTHASRCLLKHGCPAKVWSKWKACTGLEKAERHPTPNQEVNESLPWQYCLLAWAFKINSKILSWNKELFPHSNFVWKLSRCQRWWRFRILKRTPPGASGSWKEKVFLCGKEQPTPRIASWPHWKDSLFQTVCPWNIKSVATTHQHGWSFADFWHTHEQSKGLVWRKQHYDPNYRPWEI